MTSKKVSILGYIFRGVAIFFLVVAFMLLLINGTVVHEEETWAVHPTTHNRIDADSEYSYSSANFFDRMERLNLNGFGTGLETVVIIAFVLSVAYAVLSMLVKIFKKIYFCPIPLAVTALLIAVIIDNDCSYVISSKRLGTLYGYNVWTQNTLTFSIPGAIPAAILAFFAFGLLLAISLVEMISAKKTAAQVASASVEEVVTPVEAVNNEVPQE